MELLKERIRRDGKVKGTDVLKVDSFLNHQMDVELFAEIGKEFKLFILLEVFAFFVKVRKLSGAFANKPFPIHEIT